jgi:hypothetical protein
VLILSVLGKRGEQATLSQVREVDLLPNGVIREIGPMANPDEDFQATDVRRGKQLPTRRLAVAGVSESLCIIHYEQGGIGRNWILAILELTGGKAKRAGRQKESGSQTPSDLQT